MTTSLDHGILNIPLSKRGNLDAEIDRHLAEQRREARAQQKRDHGARMEARAAEKARPKMTAEEVAGARFVRDEYGWHKVVRVSAKSVTVETPYSWTERLPLAKVLEVRS